MGELVLAWTVHEGHTYLYSSSQVRRSLLRKRPGGVMKLKKAQAATTTPPVPEWKEWTGEIVAGHYVAPEEDSPTLRAWFLSFGKKSKVLLKGECRLRALLYHMIPRLGEAESLVHIYGSAYSASPAMALALRKLDAEALGQVTMVGSMRA